MPQNHNAGPAPASPNDAKNTPESVESAFMGRLENLKYKDAEDVAEGLQELYGRDDFASWTAEDLYKFVAEAGTGKHETTTEPSDYAKLGAEEKESFLNTLQEQLVHIEDAYEHVDVGDPGYEEYHKQLEKVRDALVRDGGITRSEAYAAIELARDRIYDGQDEATETGKESQTEPKVDSVPEDADKYKIDELEKDVPSMKRHASALEKLRLVKGAGFGGNATLFLWQMLGKRAEKQAKKQAKIDAMTPEQHKWYLRRNRAVVALGVLAGTVVVLGTKGFGLMNGSHTPGSFGNQNDHTPPQQPANGGGSSPAEFRAADSASLEYTNKSYNNSDSSFYDFAHKQHAGDHGTPLTANTDHARDTINGTYNAGFGDWSERGKHEPNGLGNLRVGLGLEGDDKSFEQRNKVADLLNGNPKVHEARNQETWDALNDSSKFKIETVKIEQPYTTTLMTDVNGDPVIGQQSGVDYGGEAFKITNAKTGEVTLWRKECGGFQQIWLEEKPAPAPAQQYEQSSQAVHNYTTAEKPQGKGGAPIPGSPKPGTPVNPGNPSNPGNPGNPGNPSEPETPLAGKSHDPKDYKHEEGAPKVKIDEPASEPARQEPTPAEVTTQTPGQEVSGSQQGGQASGAETTTQAEQQQQQDTPAAPGAAGAGGTPAGNTDPGNPF